MLFVFPHAAMALTIEYPASPSIIFQNHSNGFIRNIQVDWNGYPVKMAAQLAPGASIGKTFAITRTKGILPDVDSFYGTVSLYWQNADGHAFEKHLAFTQNDLPSTDILNKRLFSYVIFEMTQEGLRDAYTSHTPGAEKRREESFKALNKLYKEYH